MRWINAPGVQVGRCLFLDRDGVINEHIRGGYVLSWEAFRWRSGVVDALVRVAALGVPLVVVTNQSCIGRGLTDEARIGEIMTNMRETLHAAGVPLTAWYCCPHAPWEGCSCRKPAPGMLWQAAADLGVDLPASHLIGDSESDVAAGENAGCTTWRVDDIASLHRAIDCFVERWLTESVGAPESRTAEPIIGLAGGPAGLAKRRK